jgi:hypothetical protein
MAGSLDLLINGQNDPVGIVQFDDLKPGDEHIEHKTLRIDDNPGLVYMHLKDLEATQGAETNAEVSAEAQLGGPKFDLHNYLTYALTVDTNEIIPEGDQTLLPEVVSCWIPLGTIPGGVNIAMDQQFNFDIGVGNWAQGDVLTFTEEFFAIQVRHDPVVNLPDTGSGRFWDSGQRKCVDCQEDTETWVSQVISSSQGTLKNGGPITNSDRTDPLETLGPDDAAFFSLGVDGTLTVAFSFPIKNGAGDDLSIHEVTFGDRLTYPEEKALIDVSPDNSTWTTLGEATSLVAVNLFDLGALPEITYVRLTDTTDYGPHADNADGFEIDAIDGVYASCGNL